MMLAMTTLAASDAQASMLPKNFVDFSGLKIFGKKYEVSRGTFDPKIEFKNEKKKTTIEEIMELPGEQSKSNQKSASDPREIEKAAEYASKKTGVRKDFLMGMLAVESDLGKNTGKCTYHEVEEGARRSHEKGSLSYAAWNTFLRRREVIKDVAKEVGRDYKTLRVSCNPDNYAGTGGAMGIPQFMPDTWLEYKERLSLVLGKKNPDPWDATDGVMAMALKLADVPGVTNHLYWAEKNAAKLYLSGTVSWRYNWYADAVQYWARNYAEKLRG